MGGNADIDDVVRCRSRTGCELTTRRVRASHAHALRQSILSLSREVVSAHDQSYTAQWSGG